MGITKTHFYPQRRRLEARTTSDLLFFVNHTKRHVLPLRPKETICLFQHSKGSSFLYRSLNFTKKPTIHRPVWTIPREILVPFSRQSPEIPDLFLRWYRGRSLLLRFERGITDSCDWGDTFDVASAIAIDNPPSHSWFTASGLPLENLYKK